MRSLTIIAGLLPFLYFGTRDQIFHMRGRRVSMSEHVLHVTIGITIVMMVMQALRSHYPFLLVALALFVVTGAIDEYIYHRGIPGEESDLHAKEHLALMSWLVLVLATDWVSAHGFGLGELLTGLAWPGVRFLTAYTGVAAGES
jgi:hypothetical protein